MTKISRAIKFAEAYAKGHEADFPYSIAGQLANAALQNLTLRALCLNVIESWKRGDVSTKGTALLELENFITITKENYNERK